MNRSRPSNAKKASIRRRKAPGGGRSRRNNATAIFPRLARRGPAFGLGVLIAFAEAAGAVPALRIIRREAFSTRPGGRNRARLLESLPEAVLARVLAGIGQRHRVSVLKAILSGANTHADLRRATGLAVGPLYHHLRSLERAGLAVFVERNRYDATQLGRDLIILVTVVCAASAQIRKRNPKSNVP